MRTQMTTTNIATFGLLGAAALISIILPSSLGPRGGLAKPPTTITGDTTLDVNTIVRDFKNDGKDFGGGISTGNGHYAGNVLDSLSSAGRPVFVGVTSAPVTDFKIVDGATVPNVPYAPMITVIGSNMDTGSYLMPVTMQVHIGTQTIEPFGAFGNATLGNVDTTTGNPRAYSYPSIVAASTPIWVEGRSFTKTSSGSGKTNYTQHMNVSSKPTSTVVKVLRDGDSAPNTAGYGSQASAKTYLKNYINASGKVTLKNNQTIYLFELYTTDLSNSAADFQDLVVLVTLGPDPAFLSTLDVAGNSIAAASPKGYKVATQWRDSQGRPIAPHLMGTAAGDVAGTKGAPSSGGITSVASFDQWYSDVMGKNLSTQVPLKLKKNSSGVWEYINDAFHPIDGALLGNEGKSHNYYFTLNFGLDFTHHAGEHRFFEFQGDDDVWVFVDGKLAMDLGGIGAGVKQYLDVDRLGLSDGVKHHIEFFYAQRQESNASFRIRTNLDLGAGTTQTYTVTSTGD